MSRTVTVTPDQVESARALAEIAGGLDKVDPLIARIATAAPADAPPEAAATTRERQPAR